MAMGESVEAATAALRARWGDALSIDEAVELGGSGRSTVARVTLTGADAPASSAVIKIYPEGATTWADEAAGAAYLGRVGAGLAPDLLAVDQQRRIVVITDLGDHPQLSDALLADDPELAERALLDWADSLGELLSRTFGGREEYQRIRADLGLPSRTEFVPEQAFREPCAELAELVQAKLGIAPPAALDAELRDALDLLADREHEVVTPADLCPDNNLITPDGVRFIDLEFSGCSPVFVEVAYARVPFPTCWCNFDPPARLMAEAEETIRRRLITRRPRLADDQFWRRGMARAAALWAVQRTHGLLRRSPDLSFEPWTFPGIEVPTPDTVTIRLLSRAETMIGPELPSCAEFLTAIHHRLATDHPVPDLEAYPAFRSV